MQGEFVCYTLMVIAIGHGLAGAHVLEYRNATDTLKNILENYDKQIIPKIKGKSTEVKIQIYLSDMVPLNTLHLHFSMDFFLRQQWHDIRLAYDKGDNESVLILPGEMKQKLWVPDLYFPNAKEAKQYAITKLNGGIHVYGDGRVFSSERLSLTAFCPMDLTYFPFDVQTCYFSIGSYAYQSDDLNLAWRQPNPVLKSSPNAPLYMREFKQVDYFVSNITESYNDIGNTIGRYSVLKIEFRFYRDIQTHVFRDYIPCILTVTLSWMSFWIDFRSSPSRVALGVTTVLTMVTLSSGLKWRLPSGSKFRSVDLYLLVCNMYVFAVVIEYAFVCMKKARDDGFRRSEAKKHESSKDDKEMENLMEPNGNAKDTNETKFGVSGLSKRLFTNNITNVLDVEESTQMSSHQFSQQKSIVSLKLGGNENPNSHHVDRLCRILFPTSFIFLNILYFVFHFVHFDIENN